MIPSARMLWLVAAFFSAAAAAGILPVLRPAAFLLGILVVVAALTDAAVSRNRLDNVRASMPGRLRLYKDRQAEIALRCEAERALPKLRVGLAFPAGIETEHDTKETAASDGATTIQWKVTPHRRGQFTFSHAFLECRSRAGLWDVRRASPLGATVHVFPNMQGRDELLAIRRQSAGGHARRQLGRGREFEHLREYVPGDDLNEIDWKATARRGKPITRVFQVERTQEIYAVLDASRLTGRSAGSETRLERYIQAALALGFVAQRHGDGFGVVAFSDRVLAFVRAGRRGAQSALCRRELYRLEPAMVAPDFEDIAAQLRVQLRSRALLLFLTDLDEASTAESFANGARLLVRKHLLAAVTIRPSGTEPLFTHEAESINDVYRKIGGHLRWKALKETERNLRRIGVQFRLAGEATVSRELAGLYDEIKQRQLL